MSNFPKMRKKLTAIPKASMRETMVFCRSMPKTVSFLVKLFKERVRVQWSPTREDPLFSPISGKMKTKDKINILHDNVLDGRNQKVMLNTKIRLRTIKNKGNDSGRDLTTISSALTDSLSFFEKKKTCESLY